MHAFGPIVELTAPLFVLVFAGYALARIGRWPAVVSDALTRFVFAIAVPALLFRLMSDFSRLPAVDWRVLIVYFGGCFVVYGIGRATAFLLFRMDGASQSVFAMGGIFSNNVLLGIPIAHITLGEEAMPAISLVLVFNTLTLWILVTVSVEWARTGHASFSGLAVTTRSVLRNPVVASILAGTAFGFTGLSLPGALDRTLSLIAGTAVPLALIALGMGLASFEVREGWRESIAIAVMKLAVHPLVIWILAILLGLPARETAVCVLLSALPVGANVYLMSREFKVLGGPVAASLVLTTALAAVTTPLALVLVAPR